MKNLPTIDSFRGEYGFLSNFYPAWVMFEGKRYPTAEHAFQAAKSLNPEVRNAVAKCATPGAAKKLGRKIPLRDDWEKVKIPVMRSILQDKFLRHVELGKALKETAGQRLVEGNDWNDTFWGECRGKGENHLGVLLMETRAILNGTAVMQWQGTQAEIQDIRSHAGIKHIQPVRHHVRHLAFDTETYPILDGLLAPRVVCLTYCFDDGESGILLREDAVAFLHEQLDAGHVLVGHNVAYDFTCMAALDPDLIPKIYKAYDEGRAKDTYVREKLIMLAQGQLADAGESGAKRAVKFGLDAIVQRRFNRDISADKKGEDAWRVRYNRLDGVPLSQWPEKALNYAIDDAKWTFAVFEAQEAEVAGDVADSYTQTQAAFWLHLQGVWGVRTHPGRVNALRERIQGEFDDINAKMRKWGILKAKMVKGQEKWSKDMKKVRELVCKAYGGESHAPTTGKGAVSTSRATLMEAPHPHRPECTHDAEEDEWRCHDECLVGVLHALGRRSAVEKLLSTFLPALLQGTQFPINPRWNELVATGRTSCMNPNLQQPPRKGGVRECFVPRPGYYYIGADYSFIELCALAQVCLDLYGESALAEAINAGLDPHLDMAAYLMGIPYEEAVAIKADKNHPRHAEVGEKRQLAKAANFGLPGGLGASTFVAYARMTYGVILTEQQSRELKPIWQRKWPEMVRFHADIGNRCRFGQSFALEQLRSHRIRGGCGFCDGSNSYFQGLAADGGKRAGWLISKECYLEDPYRDGSGPTDLYGSRQVLFLHDEFILESKKEKAAAAGDRLAELMILGMKQVIPDVDVKVEPVMMDRWWKNASTVRKEGKLSLWLPEEN